jgi:hypothetical protein
MPVVMKLEFENETDAIAFFEKLVDERVRAAACTITLPDGRRLEFDRYLAELIARRDRGVAPSP